MSTTKTLETACRIRFADSGNFHPRVFTTSEGRCYVARMADAGVSVELVATDSSPDPVEEVEPYGGEVFRVLFMDSRRLHPARFSGDVARCYVERMAEVGVVTRCEHC